MVQSIDEFQKVVDSMLIQHQSILDIISKGHEASARVNRSVTKSVTSCGCLTVETCKRKIPEDATLSDLKYIFNSHIKGNLCPTCQDVVETELGKQLFYMAALANTLGLSIDDVIRKEMEKLKTLTIYNLR